MIDDDRDLLVAERPEPLPLSAATTHRARRELREQIASARLRHRRHYGVPALAAAAACAAGAIVFATTGSDAPVRATQTQHAAPKVSALEAMSFRVRQEPAPDGDATLVRRVQAYGDKVIAVDDLYADDGRYFFAHDRAALPGEVQAGNDRANGMFKREVQAAQFATYGDLSVARTKMAYASFADPSKAPKNQAEDLIDNYVWGASLDALLAGAGRPDVRAGVLRLLSTDKRVSVANTTTDGKPTLTLLYSDDGIEQERLIVDAGSGIPIKFIGGDPAQPSATITYEVSRVRLAAL